MPHLRLKEESATAGANNGLWGCVVTKGWFLRIFLSVFFSCRAAPLMEQPVNFHQNEKQWIGSLHNSSNGSVITWATMILFCVWVRSAQDPLQAFGCAVPTPSSPSLQTSVSVPSVLESCFGVFTLRNYLLSSACVSMSVMSWEGFSGVRVLALPGDASYAANHGVYLTDGQVSTRHFEWIKAWNPVLFALLYIVLRFTGSGEGHPLQGNYTGNPTSKKA